MLYGGERQRHACTGAIKGTEGDDKLLRHRSATTGSTALAATTLEGRLYGFGGDDTLTGGAGADTFVYWDSTSGHDTITDFNVEARPA